MFARLFCFINIKSVRAFKVFKVDLTVLHLATIPVIVTRASYCFLLLLYQGKYVSRDIQSRVLFNFQPNYALSKNTD